MAEVSKLVENDKNYLAARSLIDLLALTKVLPLEPCIAILGNLKLRRMIFALNREWRAHAIFAESVLGLDK